MAPYLKNKGPLLVDKIRGYFDRLPEWLRGQVTIRVEKQKVDAKINDLDPVALDSELKQEVTDEKLRTNKFLGDGEPGSGNDLSDLPVSHPSQIVIGETGQVADVTETVSGSEIGLVEGPPLVDGSSEQVGDVWVTKTVETEPFDNKSYQLQREDLIPAEFRALVPEKTEEHTIEGDAALPTLASGELVKKETQRKVGVKTVTAVSRDMTTPPVITGQKIDPEWNGAVLDLEQKIVPADTVITPVFGVTDAQIKPIDGVNALQETWKVHATPAAFPTIATNRYDADLNWGITTTQSILPVGAGLSLGTWDIDYEDKPIDSKHILRRVENVTSNPSSFNTYTTSMFTFPGILSYISFALVALAEANRKEPQWVAGIRASYTAPTTIRELTEFFTSVPAAPALYAWAQTDIIFKGISYSINLSNVLTDTWSSIGVTYSADAYWGNTVDRFNISATGPSATAYSNAIGTEVAISCVIDKFKRLWVRKTSYVILR